MEKYKEGMRVELCPFPSYEGTLDGMYYNGTMSRAVKESPYVEIITKHSTFMTCKFCDGRLRDIVPSWIKNNTPIYFI